MITDKRYFEHGSEALLAGSPRVDDDTDLREILNVIWKGKLFIAIITFLFAITSIIYAVTLHDVYKSEVLLAPVSGDGGLKMPSQLGGLAALAGVNIGGNGTDKVALALELIKSRDFVSSFITKHNLFVELMAAKGWERNNNSLLIDETIYDLNTNKWVRTVSPPFTPKPSLLESYEEFMEIFSVAQDKTTGMVTISIEHYSPYLAQKWASLLVYEINETMKNRDLSESTKSIAYLNKELEKTNVADLRAMLFALVEEQTKTLVLANVREEYVLKTVDPAVVAEKKSRPMRALIVLVITVFGGLFATIIVVVRYFNNK